MRGEYDIKDLNPRKNPYAENSKQYTSSDILQSLLISERQIAEGKTRDARESLNDLRNKYGL